MQAAIPIKKMDTLANIFNRFSELSHISHKERWKHVLRILLFLPLSYLVLKTDHFPLPQYSFNLIHFGGKNSQALKVFLPLNRLYMTNIPRRLKNFKFSENIITFNKLDQFKKLTTIRIKPSMNIIKTKQLLEQFHFYLNKSLPCFVLLNQNLKQLETLTSNRPQLIETVLQENKLEESNLN
jgi:hypothetical protein